MHLKILQWNVWYQENIENIASAIREIDPDIFCLQELGINNRIQPSNTNTPTILAEKTSFFSYFHEAHRWNENADLDAIGNGIFSRYPIKRTDYRYITKPSTHSDDYSQEGRIYIESSIEIGSKILTVGTTHMSYTDHFEITPEKKTETDNLLAILRSKKKRYLFTGDLNATPDSYTLSQITKHLYHAGPDYDHKTWTTKPFSYREFNETKLAWRLDYIFTTQDIKVLSSKVIPTNYSDHLPIVVTIEF